MDNKKTINKETHMASLRKKKTFTKSLTLIFVKSIEYQSQRCLGINNFQE